MTLKIISFFLGCVCGVGAGSLPPQVLSAPGAIFGLGGGKDCRSQTIQHTIENLNYQGPNYSVLKYTEESTVQIYKIVSCMRG